MNKKNLIRKNIYSAIIVIIFLLTAIFVVGDAPASAPTHETLYTNRIEPKSGTDIDLVGTIFINGLPLGFGYWALVGNDVYYNGGNVGIGTTSPGAKLDVSGSSSPVLRATIATGLEPPVLSFSETVFELYSSDYSNPLLRIYGAGIMHQYNPISGELINAFNPVGGNSYITGGNVGIGTTSPAEKLEVNGSILATGSICGSNGCIGSGGAASTTKGMYIGWGEDSCVPGYSELYEGWMYQGGQNNGYGGDFVCSKTMQGTIYTYAPGRGYYWEFAPSCAVCAKDENVGQCYVNWGDTTCATGFNNQYSGKMLGAGQASGQWKTSLVCAEGSASQIYRHYSAYGWETSPDCSVCCNDEAGGIFTKWGQYGTTTSPPCPGGYQTLYSGMMFQSGQRDGYGSNAVCGASAAANNEVYLYDRWTTVPCSVCEKTNEAGSCFTVWGESDLASVPPGYTKIYSGKMYSAGVSGGNGGGLVCSENLKTAVYIYDAGLKWMEYPCALYCADTPGGEYTSWGSNSCAAGYTNIHSGYMYQGGQSLGHGGELKCAIGKQTQLYTYTAASGYTWVNAPECAVCANPSTNGLCYTSWGSHTCAEGYASVSEGYIFQGGVGGGYGQGTVCSTDTYLPRRYINTYYSGYGNVWDPGRPCATCCLLG